MSHTRAKATNWVTGDPITPTQINKIADDLVDVGTYNIKGVSAVAGLSGAFNTTSEGLVDITGLSASVTGAVGDKLVVSMMIPANNADATLTQFTTACPSVTDGGVDVDKIDLQASTRQCLYSVGGGPGYSMMPFFFIHTVVNAGTVTVKGKCMTSAAAATATVYANAQMTVTHIRP